MSSSMKSEVAQHLKLLSTERIVPCDSVKQVQLWQDVTAEFEKTYATGPITEKSLNALLKQLICFNSNLLSS